MRALFEFSKLVLIPVVLSVVLPGLVIFGLIYCFEYSLFGLGL